MMRSMWSAVAGLKTHQLEMDVIGNNIANVNTTAYKSQATGFQDVLYQTVKEGTGAGQRVAATNIAQVGLGSKLGSVYTNIAAQGSAITTNNVMDLMITGPSFFIISPDSQILNYGRDGSFSIDAEGDLVTQNNGYYVMGVMGDGGVADGAAVTKLRLIDRKPVTETDEDGNITTKMVDYMDGEGTKATYMKGNLDSEDATLAEGKALLLEVYGDDGGKYTLKFNITDSGDDDISTFNMKLASVADEYGNPVGGKDTNEIELAYDKHTGIISSATKDGSTITYSKNEKGKVVPSGSLTMNVEGVGSFELDLSNTTNFAGGSTSHASTIYAYKGDTKGLQKGFPRGELTGLSFGTDGSVYGTYSNGQTIKKAQIAVAEFSNAMGLEKVGDNLYQASLNSGAAMIQDITKDGGYMNSGVLEGSNIDLAKEFTDMITTQRGFQANSRVITTSDEMLQILKGLKR
ncbi:MULTISPECIES: flagellar hook protein FlgE [unclassified Butyrivibrio]|uniref:flagellar hook protein FlgE n=1 Tax=unclassified Butyrivibrio TaxID=2639466 RepID=UPI0003B718BD|nr:MULTISPECIES: flagellar hook-basal body complex protein [unclassified Butyrivibrio]MBO6197482.1 flagellar hook-basal body complex protein [Butyrivibrio sp.]